MLRLYAFSHEVFPAEKAEDGYLVVFVQDSQCTENLVQRRTACGYIIDNKYVVVPQSMT